VIFKSQTNNNNDIFISSAALSKIRCAAGTCHSVLTKRCAFRSRAKVAVHSAVTIIVVTIFIAIFQNYHMVFLSRYFLCVRNDIFARYLRYASTIEFTASLLKFQHASITCHEGRDACDCRPANVAEQRLHP